MRAMGRGYSQFAATSVHLRQRNFRHCRAVTPVRSLSYPHINDPAGPESIMKAHYSLLFLALAAPLALLARAPGSATDTGHGNTILSGPTAAQATTAKLVYGLLSDSRYAYRPRALDDARR